MFVLDELISRTFFDLNFLSGGIEAPQDFRMGSVVYHLILPNVSHYLAPRHVRMTFIPTAHFIAYFLLVDLLRQMNDTYSKAIDSSGMQRGYVLYIM